MSERIESETSRTPPANDVLRQVESDPDVIAARRRLEDVGKIRSAAHEETKRIETAIVEASKLQPKHRSRVVAILDEIQGIPGPDVPTTAEYQESAARAQAAAEAHDVVRDELTIARYRVGEAIGNARREQHRSKLVDIANALLQLGECMEAEAAFRREFHDAGLPDGMVRFTEKVGQPVTLRYIGNWLSLAADGGVIEPEAVPEHWR